MRYYAAIITGMLTGIAVMAGLWCWTTMDVIKIAVLGVAAYIAGIGVFLLATEPKPRKTRKFQTYDLRKEDAA